MFCPRCEDEYRPGFTRCGSCAVDLVEQLGPGGTSRVATSPLPAAAPVSLVDFCGFLSLDEAREARARLRAVGIRTEIAIRDALLAPDEDEHWLRVDRGRMQQVVAELGYEPAEIDESAEGFRCDACGAAVVGDAAECPKCGARFEDPP